MSEWPQQPLNYQPPQSGGGPSGKAIASLVLGILSIPGACIPIVGAILGAIGLSLGKNERHTGPGKAGFICSIVGLVLAGLNFVAGIILRIATQGAQ